MMKRSTDTYLAEPTLEGIEDAAKRFQELAAKLETEIESALQDEVTLVLPPRVEELEAELDEVNSKLYIGRSRVEFPSDERYNVAEILIQSAGRWVAENDLVSGRGLPDENADIPVWINRIRDDIEEATLRELERLVGERAGGAALDQAMEAALKEEARRIRAVLPTAKKVDAQRSYVWDSGILRVTETAT